MKEDMTNVIVKLTSGEEIFAELVSAEEETITILNPMKVQKRYVESPEGLNIKLNYEPFLDYSGSTQHTFKKIHIMQCEPLIPRLSDLYGDMLKDASRYDVEKESRKEDPTDDASIIIPENMTIH